VDTRFDAEARNGIQCQAPSNGITDLCQAKVIIVIAKANFIATSLLYLQ